MTPQGQQKFILNLKMAFCTLCWCGPSALEPSSRRKALCVAYTHLCTTCTYILPGHHYGWNFHIWSRNYEKFDLLNQNTSHFYPKCTSFSHFQLINDFCWDIKSYLIDFKWKSLYNIWTKFEKVGHSALGKKVQRGS